MHLTSHMQNSSVYTYLESMTLKISAPRDIKVSFLCCVETHLVPIIITRGQQMPYCEECLSCCCSDALRYSSHLHTKVSYNQDNYIYLNLR